MLGRQTHRVLDLAAREAVAVAQQRPELADEGLDAVDAIAGALDDEFVPAGADAHAEEIFEQAQVVVVGAEQDVDALVRDRNGPRGRDGDTGSLLKRNGSGSRPCHYVRVDASMAPAVRQAASSAIP